MRSTYGDSTRTDSCGIEYPKPLYSESPTDAIGMNICPECSQHFPDDQHVCSNDGTLLVSARPEIDPLLGTLFDEKYRIIERLGAGGMGAVYRAEHIIMKREAAIKIVHNRLIDDGARDEFLQRFQSEARTASKIKHPNAITIYDFGIFEGNPYLVMELIEGRSLKTLLKENGALPVETAAAILSQICSALEEAHAVTIVHRDIKPDNIMISQGRDGGYHATVLDFGLAKPLAAEGSQAAGLTQSGVILGTPQYMSPEQIRGQAIDHRSDIYSVGVVFYEMLTGAVPFQADSMTALLLKHITEPPPSIRTFAPDLKLPPQLEQVVLTALAKNPEERHCSARAFSEAVLKAAEEAPVADAPEKGRTKRRSKALPMAAFILAVLLIGSGVLYFRFEQKLRPLTETIISLARLSSTAGTSSGPVDVASPAPQIQVAAVTEEASEQDNVASVESRTEQIAEQAIVVTAEAAEPEIEQKLEPTTAEPVVHEAEEEAEPLEEQTTTEETTDEQPAQDVDVTDDSRRVEAIELRAKVNSLRERLQDQQQRIQSRLEHSEAVVQNQEAAWSENRSAKQANLLSEAGKELAFLRELQDSLNRVVYDSSAAISLASAAVTAEVLFQEQQYAPAAERFSGLVEDAESLLKSSAEIVSYYAAKRKAEAAKLEFESHPAKASVATEIAGEANQLSEAVEQSIGEDRFADATESSEELHRLYRTALSKLPAKTQDAAAKVQPVKAQEPRRKNTPRPQAEAGRRRPPPRPSYDEELRRREEALRRAERNAERTSERLRQMEQERQLFDAIGTLFR